MEILTSKDLWLINQIISNIRLTESNNKQIIEILLGNLPKDKYTSDEILNIISLVQQKCQTILEEQSSISIEELKKSVKKQFGIGGD